MLEAYEILDHIGRLDGIAVVGMNLGVLLCLSGDIENGLEILTRSRDGFLKLGQSQRHQYVQSMIDRFSGANEKTE